MIKTWTIDYKQKFGKTSVPTTTAIEGPNTPEEAKLEFLKKNPDAKGVKVRAGTSHCETYEELVEWLRCNQVAPARRRGRSRSWSSTPASPRNRGYALPAAATTSTTGTTTWGTPTFVPNATKSSRRGDRSDCIGWTRTRLDLTERQSCLPIENRRWSR